MIASEKIFTSLEVKKLILCHAYFARYNFTKHNYLRINFDNFIRNEDFETIKSFIENQSNTYLDTFYEKYSMPSHENVFQYFQDSINVVLSFFDDSKKFTYEGSKEKEKYYSKVRVLEDIKGLINPPNVLKIVEETLKKAKAVEDARSAKDSDVEGTTPTSDILSVKVDLPESVSPAVSPTYMTRNTGSKPGWGASSSTTAAPFMATHVSSVPAPADNTPIKLSEINTSAVGARTPTAWWHRLDCLNWFHERAPSSRTALLGKSQSRGFDR